MSALHAIIGSIICLVTCISFVSTFYIDEYIHGNRPYDDATYDVDKRGLLRRPMPFPCNGLDHYPRCLHGGKGPRKTMTKAGRFCVCLCPPKWVGPECGYVADSFRKRYPWHEKRSLSLINAGSDREDLTD